jgi:hypothetical protein
MTMCVDILCKRVYDYIHSNAARRKQESLHINRMEKVSVFLLSHKKGIMYRM